MATTVRVSPPVGEEREMLQQRAAEAVEAFRSYLITGDENQYLKFQEIFYGQYPNRPPMREIPEFMDPLMRGVDALREDEEIKPLLEAFSSDIGPMQESVMIPVGRGANFIDAVHEVRKAIEAGEEMLEQLKLRFPALIGVLSERLPEEQAELAVSDLKDFILTGNLESQQRFERTYAANESSDDFINEFQSLFVERIVHDEELGPIVNVYKDKVGEFVPIDFAQGVARLYAAARTRGEEGMQEFRDLWSSDVVDPLLSICARGMARRAMELLAEVLQTGSSRAAGEFAEIMNTTFLGLKIDYNDSFWNEFQSLYGQEMASNSRFLSMARSFQRNFLPIAVRDAYTELGKLNPDDTRLRREYGDALVDIIAANYQAFGWLIRSGDAISAELRSRADIGDTVAQQLRAMQPDGSAVASVYSALMDERMRRRSLADSLAQSLSLNDSTPVLQAIVKIEQNFDSLVWLGGTPQEIEAELRSRVAAGEQLAADLLAALPQNTGESLAALYAEVAAGREERQRLGEEHGSRELVDFIYENLDALAWVVKPVEDVEQDMRSRDGDSVLRSVFLSTGYSLGALAQALKEIYSGTRTAVGREQLVALYGEPLVSFVETNRSALGWLSGSAQDIESGLQERSDPAAQQLRRDFLYSYVPAQLVTAVVTAQKAIATSAVDNNAIPLADANASLGRLFVSPVFPPTVMTLEPIAPEQALEETKAAITDTYTAIENDLRDLESQLSYDIFEPVRASLQQRISQWRMQNASLMDAANATQDIESLEALANNQKLLRDSMLLPTELRRCVELAFALMQMAETGGNLGSFTGTSGDITAEINNSDMGALLDWYNGLHATRPGVQPVVSDVVAAVLQRANSELYDFIAQSNRSPFFGALMGAYLGIKTGIPPKDQLVQSYGEQFVTMVSENMDKLKFLESPAATIAGVPEELRTPLRRAYQRQDAALFDAMSTVYAVLSDEPPLGAPQSEKEAFEARVRELKSGYGDSFVQLVRDSRERLGFLRDPMADVSDIPQDLLEPLYAAYEAGPRLARSNFMENFVNVAQRLPTVYLEITSALMFSNAADAQQVAMRFMEAVSFYRTEFGDSDYLFNLYINMDLLSRSVLLFARERGIELSPALSDGITSPEEIVLLFQSEAGKELLKAGKDAFRTLNQTYSDTRQATDYHPDTGEFTDSRVQGLSNELSVFDALYLGVALEVIGGAPSSFQAAAANGMMETIMLLAHRDPYLIGPYLLQVVPALLTVCQDEVTLVTAMNTFSQLLTTRYGEGQRGLAYSNSVNRQYFLEVFARIAGELPMTAVNFDQHNLEDELRVRPEPMTDEGYIGTDLYRYTPGFWSPQEMEGIPALYAQYGIPVRLLPDVTMPTTPYLAVPGGYTIDSGAVGLHTSMAEGVQPPEDRMFASGVPPRYRIGALGASTIIRKLTQLFGPMPVDYSDYWLRQFGEGGMFYSGGATRGTGYQRGGAAAGYGGRTITGGVRGAAYYTGEELTAPGAAAPSARHAVRTQAEASGLPLPMAGPIPLVGVEGGLQRAREEFNWERSTRPSEEGGTETYRENYGGVLETYSRIAMGEPDENGQPTKEPTDMLVFISGQYVPELRGPVPQEEETPRTGGVGGGLGEEPFVTPADLYPEIRVPPNVRIPPGATAAEAPQGPLLQEEQGRMKGRLYFITKEGDVYQLACGLDTESQLMNYLYGGANTENVLASLRFIGKDMLSGEAAEAGFDGAAIGFSIPTGGGDSFSALAFGEIVRNINTMTPIAVDQAVGMAVTHLLADRSQRDIYAGFYRGTQSVTVDPNDMTHITDTSWATGTGEFMWRRMRIDPMEPSWELRVAGGYPTVAGASWRHEIPVSEEEIAGYGITAAYSEIDLLRDFSVVSAEADAMYSKMVNALVTVYGWDEDRAKDTGWLVAASYLYGRLEDWIERNPDGSYTTTEVGPEGRPNPNYASLLFMYWAQRHNILVGGERLPGFADRGGMYELLDTALKSVQRNPDREAAIYTELAEQLKSRLESDIWKFALGYGYDGERVRVYIVGGAEYRPGRDEVSGNLRALFLFGRPTSVYAEVTAHAFTYAPLVLSETRDSEGGTSVSVVRGTASPYMSIYASLGIVDWPAAELSSFERPVVIAPEPTDILRAEALRDCYRELGSYPYGRERLIRLYGREFVELVESGREDLAWLIRPADEVARELQARMGNSPPDPLAAMLMRRSGTESAEEAATAIIDIYTKLRITRPDQREATLAGLQNRYGESLVSAVESHAYDLDWMLLSPAGVVDELGRRAGQAGAAADIARLQVAELPHEGKLTRDEVQRMFEENMPQVVAAATNALSEQGVNAERYDVIMGSYLRAEPADMRHDHLYVLITDATLNEQSRYSLMVGNDDDFAEWMQAGYIIGRGVVRLEINRTEEGDYEFLFSGDRRLRLLTGVRAFGGVTLPLQGEAYDRYDPEKNWTAGVLLQILESNKGDLIAGALFGQRDLGDERWDQWTVTLSGNLQLAQNDRLSDQMYGYIFFNWITHKVTVASEDEFEQICEQQRQECQQFGDYERMTGGIGFTWARVNVTTGDSLNLHFFFEGGVETRRQLNLSEGMDVWGNTVPGSVTLSRGSDLNDAFIMRSGIGFEYVRAEPGAFEPTSYGLFLTGASGAWPLTPGEITREEYLYPYLQDVTTTPADNWWIMLYGRIRW